MSANLAAAFAAAAESRLGAPFRLHGRDPRTGLDCVGLVLSALTDCGVLTSEPPHYGLRNSDLSAHLLAFADNQFALTTGPVKGGDLLLVRPGPAQYHLIVALGADAFVHAHAGLRKVVKLNSGLPWPVRQHWRLREAQR